MRFASVAWRCSEPAASEDVDDGEVELADRFAAAAVELETIVQADGPDRSLVAEAGPRRPAKVVDRDHAFVQIEAAAVDERGAGEPGEQREAKFRVQIHQEIAARRM